MKNLKTLTLFILGFIIMAMALELFFRKGGILNPILEIDPVRGEMYIPNRISNSLFVMEGFGLSRTNSDGWFGKIYETPEKEERAIGVIGNSYVAARQVFERDNFISIAESELKNNRSDSRISLYNFGSEGMTVEQLLYTKEWVFKKYSLSSAIVLLNTRSFEPIRRMMPHYESINDSLTLNTKFLNSSKYKLYKKFEWLNRSSLAFLGYRVKNQLSFAPEIIFDKLHPKNQIEEDTHAETDIHVNDEHKVILTELAKDPKLIFMLDLPNKTTNIIKGILPASRIIDLQPTLKSLKELNGIDPNYFKVGNQRGHWNYHAHRAVGIRLASELSSIIEKDSKP